MASCASGWPATSPCRASRPSCRNGSTAKAACARGTSRATRPYFGFQIPGHPGKYFYVWLDAPIGYLSSLQVLCEREGLNFFDFLAHDSAAELHHFIGKDIVNFHGLFWPAVLHGAGFRAPTRLHVNGYLTVDGAKMSKSRGTFVMARTYLDAGLDPEALRYYFAAKSGGGVDDVDLNLADFVARVNSDLVGKFVNLASRCAGFIEKRFDGRLADALPEPRDVRTLRRRSCPRRRRGLRTQRAGQRAAHRDGAGRRSQPLHRRAQAVGARQAGRRGRRTAGGVHAGPEPVPRPGRHAQAGAATRSRSMPKPSCGAPIAQWNDLEAPLLERRIAPYTPLFTRIDPKQIDTMIEASKDTLQARRARRRPWLRPKPPRTRSRTATRRRSRRTIAIDDFARLDLRVGKVLACEFVEGSDKLLRFELDAGRLGRRQIFSGIRASYGDPERLVGRKVVFIANLAPRKMRFGISEGMILSAGFDGGELFLLDVDNGAQPGMPVK